VVIDANQEIVQVRGQTDPYLQLAAGRANLNVLKMARPGLSVGLRTALQSARKEGNTIIREGLHVSAFGTTRLIRITVTPLKGPPAKHCLVIFEELEHLSAPLDSIANSSEPGEQKDLQDLAQRQIATLEQELSSQHDEIQTILQERDSANQELQASNEEIRATNEELLASNEAMETSKKELQSLNEALETSKEELQVINEKLRTANQELATQNEQLNATQDYAESIVETGRSPLLILTEELHIEHANVAFYQYFQITPQETEGALLYELDYGQWNIPHLRTLLEEILPTNNSINDFELEYHFPRIGDRTLLLNARRLLSKSQAFQKPRILLAMEDITRRREAERQLQARLTFLQHLLDALPNSVYLVHGNDARLVLANRATLSLWGAPWKIGQPMLDFLESNQIHIFDTQGNILPPAAFATMRVLSEGKTVFQHQQTITHADGTTLPVMVNAIPMKGQDLLTWMRAEMDNDLIDDILPTALVIHQDVTFLKEAENLKDRFLGLVAHELRTPLTTIKGYASSLLMESASGKGTPLEDWQQEAIAEIDLGADLLNRLTNDLLDVVRLQGKRLVLYPDSLNLITLTQHVVTELQRTTDRHHLSLSLIPASLSELLARVDKDRIQQILSNLLSNAIKYSPHGGAIETTLRKEVQGPEQATVVISITDHGIGIPQAEHANIFGRFARASNGETHKIRGTGLGLYLCRELVLQHKGQIWFESHEGIGSTFFVRLSLLPDRSASSATIEHASSML
jgi:signal transduction histidine kinase